MYQDTMARSSVPRSRATAWLFASVLMVNSTGCIGGNDDSKAAWKQASFSHKEIARWTHAESPTIDLLNRVAGLRANLAEARRLTEFMDGGARYAAEIRTLIEADEALLDEYSDWLQNKLEMGADFGERARQLIMGAYAAKHFRAGEAAPELPNLRTIFEQVKSDFDPVVAKRIGAWLEAIEDALSAADKAQNAYERVAAMPESQP